MNRHRLCRICAVALLAGATMGSAFADPIGLWRGSDGGTTRIVACGTALCGFLASINPPDDPATGRPWTDKHNSDPAKRDNPLVGAEVLINMRPNGQGRWSGHLYYYERGGIYSGNLTEVDANTIRVEGCLWIICDGDTLTRVK